ncbi:MAG TPA: hypothetical protein VGM50_15295 [Gemmatimonadaceae bacterium]|jgi:hypothetical protein
MSTSFTTTASETFTVTHARHIASKVATDLHRFQRFYGSPSTTDIAQYEQELVVLLKYDYLKDVIYGFKRAGKWTEAAVRYVALPDGRLSGDDDPGKIRPGFDISNATFGSFLCYNDRWGLLSASQQDEVTREYSLARTTASTPTLEAGWWQDDLNYYAGGRGIGRSVVRR